MSSASVQKAPNQKSNTKSQQKLIQDQNYSNEIFFGLLSTVESIVLKHKGIHQT